MLDKNIAKETKTPSDDVDTRPPMQRPLRWLWLAVAVIALDLVTKYVASLRQPSAWLCGRLFIVSRRWVVLPGV